MKDLLITLLIVATFLTLLIAPFRIHINETIETYSTNDLNKVQLYYAELNNGLTIESDKLTVFWFHKDDNFKHFTFKVKRYTNLYGMESSTLIKESIEY